MAIIPFDSLAYVKSLEDAGMPRAQAEALGRQRQKTVEDISHSKDVARREDIDRLAAQMKEMDTRLTGQIREMDTRLTTQMDEKITQAKYDLIRWMVGVGTSIIGAMVAMAIGAFTVFAPYLDILRRLAP